MEQLADLLKPHKVKLSEILLDPNNPRFVELGEEIDRIPENRFDEKRIQLETFQKMKSDIFDVSELRDTIKTLGFLPMDRIVVRKWNTRDKDSGRYVVVEGNRRVTALKWLIDLHSSDKETFSEAQIDNFTNLEVLLFDEFASSDLTRWVLPGLRHVSGIKEWGPYQKARAVAALKETGRSPQETAQSLGLSVRAANQLWRSYLALEQMSNDEEYGDYADPKKFSYFEEIFKNKNVRDWLNWDDSTRRFLESDKLREIYSWIVGDIEEESEKRNPKLPESKSIRELGRIIGDPIALSEFISHGGSLVRALGLYEAGHPENWTPIISRSIEVLSNLSPDKLRSMPEGDVERIRSLQKCCSQVLQDRSTLMDLQHA